METPKRYIHQKRRSTEDLQQESQTIKAAQSGDEQALENLYAANSIIIFRYIHKRVENVDVARDLTSDVFLRLIEGLQQYENRGVPFLAWLYRIAHARLVDHFRKTNYIGVYQTIEEADLQYEDDTDDRLTVEAQQQQVRDAIAELTPAQREVIRLRFIEGYNLQQTADTLGKDIGAVKMTQHRGLEDLRATFKRKGITYE